MILGCSSSINSIIRINNSINRICINSSNSSSRVRWCIKGVIGISATSGIAGMNSRACLGGRCRWIRPEEQEEDKQGEEKETKCGRHVRYEYILSRNGLQKPAEELEGLDRHCMYVPHLLYYTIIRCICFTSPDQYSLLQVCPSAESHVSKF